MTEEPETEWAVWEAAAGFVTLPEGERILVRGGDEVLIDARAAGFVVLDYRAVLRN